MWRVDVMFKCSADAWVNTSQERFIFFRDLLHTKKPITKATEFRREFVTVKETRKKATHSYSLLNESKFMRKFHL